MQLFPKLKLALYQRTSLPADVADVADVADRSDGVCCTSDSSDWNSTEMSEHTPAVRQLWQCVKPPDSLWSDTQTLWDQEKTFYVLVKVKSFYTQWEHFFS